MKRFLSIILAAALVISLVPSVFAEGETVYTYNFDNVALGKENVAGKDYAQIVKGDVASLSDNTWEVVYVNSNNERIFTTGIAGNTNGGSKPTASTGWGFELTVPQKGTYVPTVIYDMAPRGAIITTLVFSGTTFKNNKWAFNSAGVANILSTFGVTEAYKFDTYDETAGGLKIDKASDPVVLPRTDLDEGANYMLFSPSEYNEKMANSFETNTSFNAQFEIRSLTLTKVPAAKVEIEQADKLLSIGDTLNLTAKVYDSENAEISDTVTFESSAPSVASVDENGVVTAKAIGTATITAKASNGKADTVKVTVGGSVLDYQFTSYSMTDGFTSEDDVLDKEGKLDGNNYEYIADGYGKWDLLNGYGVQTLRLYGGNFYFRMARGAAITPGVNGITYRINVPAAGKYKLKFNYFDSPSGLKTGVWFVDEKMLAEKNITMAGTTSNTGCRRVMVNFDPDIEIDTYNEEADTDVTNLPASRLIPVMSEREYNLAAGEYYVVVGATGISWDNSPAGAAAAGNEDGAFSFILYRNLELIKVGDYVAPEVPSSPAKTDLFVYSPILGAVTSEDIKVGEKLDIPVGTEISLKAEETVGDYSFVGWKNGAGILLSTNPEEKFDIITKTVIMAVYDKKDDSSKVEFWNANGSLIKTVPVDAGAKFGDIEKPSASLNGYGAASGWSISDDTEINGIVRAVAVYDYEDTGIKVSNVKVNGTAVEDAVYNQKLNLSESGATYWTRNAKTVAFGESFVHYVFNSANGSAIVAHKGAVTVRPVVTLDTNNGDYSMIEYDAAGMKIVEAGIIYGPNKNISLNSYVTKASVKNIKKHGQFIAAPNPDSSLDQSVARGYIVYINDKNEYKVAYSD